MMRNVSADNLRRLVARLLAKQELSPAEARLGEHVMAAVTGETVRVRRVA